MSISQDLRPTGRAWPLAAALIGATLADPATAHDALGGVPPGLPEAYFTGGRNGTVFDTTSHCLEMPAPAVQSNPGLLASFNAGETVFDSNFVTDPAAPTGGLGPLYINTSCRNCHPNYGRARRVESHDQEFGNGYTTYVHTPDGKLVEGYLFMLQTMAVPPYEPLAKGVTITWNDFVDKHGNRYPDGTPYNAGKPTEGKLSYPTADVVEPLLPLPADYRVSIEATIGLFGTGLLDAIPDADIVAEHERQAALPGPIKGKLGKWVEEPHDGQRHLGRFTHHATRATLQNGPGFNGIWNTFNVTRLDRPKLFATEQWIAKQGELGHDTAALTGPQPEELSQTQLGDLLLWSRGLAVPAARNLDDPQVRRGGEVFATLRCQECHKPVWTTGDYPAIPGYGGQKIRPYTDMLLHDMGEENRGLVRSYRTPPLWARGVMRNAADHSDMFHDLRARDFEEAVLWHFGEAEPMREGFRQLPAPDRAAILRFLEAL